GTVRPPGGVFMGTGPCVWDRRPESSIGPLMTAVGFTWFFRPLMASNEELPFALGAIFASVPYAVLIQLLLSFPSGHLETRLQRGVVALAYFVCIPMQFAWALFTDPEKDGCEGCPETPFLIEGHHTLSLAINSIEVILAITSIVLTVVLIYRRWKRSEPRQRRALSPLILT